MIASKRQDSVFPKGNFFSGSRPYSIRMILGRIYMSICRLEVDCGSFMVAAKWWPQLMTLMRGCPMVRTELIEVAVP